MPTPIYKGDTRPAQQRYVERWNPQTGYSREYEYEGHNTEFMRAVMANYINSGWDVTLTVDNQVASLVIQDPNGSGNDPSLDPTLDTWQITQSDVTASVFDNPRNISTIGNNDIKVLARAVSFLSKKDPFADAMESLTKEAGGTWTKPTGAAALRLWERVKAGADSYVFSRYILRHTTNAPQYWGGISVCDTNIDKIYTIAQLISECSNSNYWLLPLPPAFITAINGGISSSIPTPRNQFYTKGALKRGASRVTTARFRQEITNEYWFGEISNDEYAAATF